MSVKASLPARFCIYGVISVIIFKSLVRSDGKTILMAVLAGMLFVTGTLSTKAQTNSAQSAPDTEAQLQRRLARARAMAAAHNLSAAAFELDAIRSSTTDASTLDV